MLNQENGVQSGSDYYFFTASEEALEIMYYVTSCGEFWADYGYSVERENYNNYMIFYILEGTLSVTSGGVTKKADKGKIGFIDCHLPHEYHAIGFTHFLWLHFDGLNSSQFYRYLFKRNNGFIMATSQSALVCDHLKNLVDTCRSGQPLFESYASLQIYRMMLLMVDSPREKMKIDTDSPAGKGARFIDEHFGEAITLGDIASYAGVSVYYFTRLFKADIGSTPYDYLLRRRIDSAKYQLKTTKKSIKDIAVSVGYDNESTFINFFTERVGLSPGKFRRYPI